MNMKNMAELQGATPPPWLGRPRWRLVADAVGGLRANLDKIVQLAGLVAAYLRPSVLRRRFERLRALGHVDVVPTWAEALLAGRDQMMLSASEETKLFYASQGIPWIFHNARRFLSGPATMLDPIGLFSPRDTIVEHVLQTFHRHRSTTSCSCARTRAASRRSRGRSRSSTRARTHTGAPCA